MMSNKLYATGKVQFDDCFFSSPQYNISVLLSRRPLIWKHHNGLKL